MDLASEKTALLRAIVDGGRRFRDREKRILDDMRAHRDRDPENWRPWLHANDITWRDEFDELFQRLSRVDHTVQRDGYLELLPCTPAASGRH